MIEEYLLLLAYCYLGARAAMCGNWWKALYWLGSLVVTLAVVKGIKK